VPETSIATNIQRKVDARRAGRYGIDAPLIPLLGSLAVIANLVLGLIQHASGPLIAAAIMAVPLASFLYTTLRGKFVVWSRVLAGLGLRGDEQILDLGCGRGAVLCMAAALVPNGRVSGVDIWSRSDQSGNGPDMTRRNAAAEGVAERIELHTADMRQLPFADASFDLIISNMAIHNIGSAAGREQAIDEALRVLRPGGRLVIADILHAGQYRKRLIAGGARDVQQSGLGWRMWWGGPWLSTSLVTASRPR